jgi:hypothetical protein
VCIETLTHADCTFDDGGSVVTGNSTTTHTYTSPYSDPYAVSLSVACADGNNPQATRYVCISFGFSGCILDNNGWN